MLINVLLINVLVQLEKAFGTNGTDVSNTPSIGPTDDAGCSNVVAGKCELKTPAATRNLGELSLSCAQPAANG